VGDSGPPTLTWYTNPDTGARPPSRRGARRRPGKYEITTSGLPTDATAQREQLLRRLAGSDTSVDLMSLDPPFTAEFATAGFLADIPEDRTEEFTEGIFQPAVNSATWEDKLVAVPFWANTQLLWYRKSVAQSAGLNMSQPVTWDQIVKAAQSENKTVAAQGLLYEGYTVWINALVESAGANVVTNPEAAAGGDRARHRLAGGRGGGPGHQSGRDGRWPRAVHPGGGGRTPPVPGRRRGLPRELALRLGRLGG
jgi:multiple sugar transport system substrate-binding protein